MWKPLLASNAPLYSPADDQSDTPGISQRIHGSHEVRAGWFSHGGRLRDQVLQLLHALEYFPQDRQASRLAVLEKGVPHARWDVLRGTRHGSRRQSCHVREMDLGRSGT